MTHNSTSAKGKKPVNSRFVHDEECFSKLFGTPVVVKETRKGSGQIIIPFKNQLDFERIAKLLNKYK